MSTEHDGGRRWPAPTNGPPPAWYPDPERPGWWRWWDGTAWSEWRQPAAAPGAPARTWQIGWTIAVVLGGPLLWLLSIAILLAENLSDDGSTSLDLAKRISAVAFYGLPFVVAGLITAIWVVPRVRARRRLSP